MRETRLFKGLSQIKSATVKTSLFIPVLVCEVKIQGGKAEDMAWCYAGNW